MACVDPPVEAVGPACHPVEGLLTCPFVRAGVGFPGQVVGPAREAERVCRAAPVGHLAAAAGCPR